jgi:hypothetical protein
MQFTDLAAGPVVGRPNPSGTGAMPVVAGVGLGCPSGVEGGVRYPPRGRTAGQRFCVVPRFSADFERTAHRWP